MMADRLLMDGQGFNFTGRMRMVVDDVASRLPELRHVNTSRVAFAFAQARKRSQYGTFASLTPMRFRNGQLTAKRYGRDYTVQRLYDADGVEMLYILSFFLPRFMDLDFGEKLVTILHELWHISPNFDGDIRRHPGRCYAHTHSQKEYDAQMQILVNRWLALNPPESLYRFLQLDFTELNAGYGPIYGTRIPHPKLIPARAVG